jgi:dihydroxyacetone kinase-like predicted kinase
MLVSSLLACVFVNSSNGASLENAVHVKNEAELKNAINSVTSNKVTIALDNDISFIDNIVISANKDVTLTSNRGTGFYKLIGASDETFGVDYSEGTNVVVEGGVLRG